MGARLIGLAFAAWLIFFAALDGCSRTAGASREKAKPSVLAVENFLADITSEVAGDTLAVQSLLPEGADPHTYEPTPRDIASVAGADLVIINGSGLEGFIQKLIENARGGAAGKGLHVVEASAGLKGRTAREGEAVELGQTAGSSGAPVEIDPHFWLDPVLVVHYVQNIRDALKVLDPADTATFEKNAASYIAKLDGLDRWISKEVSAIPPADRKIVTNHESFGYFADRYGFQVIGTVIPGVSSDAAPTARQLARLVDRLKAAHVKAIFLETGTNQKLARQVAMEAGVMAVRTLYDHSLSAPDGPAPTYIDMMRYDAKSVVDALKDPPRGQEAP